MHLSSSDIVSSILKWNLFHAAWIIVFTAISYYQASMTPILLGGISSFLIYIAILKKEWKEIKPIYGIPNLITTARLLILILGFYFHAQLGNVNLFYLLFLFICLDFFDGYFARKLNQTSHFGKYLDMETDAFYVLLITVFLYFKGYFPALIIGVGLLRYLNIIADKLFINKDILDPKIPLASTIAVILFFSLITPLVLDEKYYYPLVVISCALVSLSFGYTFTYKAIKAR